MPFLHLWNKGVMTPTFIVSILKHIVYITSQLSTGTAQWLVEMKSPRESCWKLYWQVFKYQVDREGFSFILEEFFLSFHQEGGEGEEKGLLFPVCIIKM